MATSFAPRTALQRSTTPASTSLRCSSNNLSSLPTLPAALQLPGTLRTLRRPAAVTQAFQGSCWDGRRGSSRRGAWGPLLWNVNGPMAGATLEDLAREFGFAAYPGCAPNMTGGNNQAQRNMKGFWTDLSNQFSLPLDTEEQADQYLLTADVPGLQKADLKITVNKSERTLSISGERRRTEATDSDTSAEESQKFKRRFERRMGKINRTVASLPDNADLGSATARVDKGVLTITIKKVPEPEVPNDSFNINVD